MILALMVMLLWKTLEVIMFDYTKLINNIKRSEFAYKAYQNDKNYHHALHIFYANEIIYSELTDLLRQKDLADNILESIFNYLFHLEDWFLQFTILEQDESNPEQDFIFGALKNTTSYPADFVKELKI